MKKIKPIVLKDAKKLTNSEMKKIYAGGTAMGEPDSSCTVYCDLHTGALVPEITEYNCQYVAVDPNEYYCVVNPGVSAYCQSRYTGNTVQFSSSVCQYMNGDVEDTKFG